MSEHFNEVVQKFDPESIKQLTINGAVYDVIPISSDPFDIMQTTAGRAHVCRLKDDAGNQYALKYYTDATAKMFSRHHPVYNHREVFDTQNRLLNDIPALAWIKDRTYISPDDTIAKQYPNLAHAILMPWIHGDTVSVLRTLIRDKTRTPFHPSEINKIASSLLESMVMLEDRGYAHGDICGENIIVCTECFSVHIVDIDEMYIPILPIPITLITLPPGHAEYRFPQNYNAWSAESDRFSFAILLSEVLTLQDFSAATIGAHESLFTEHELPPTSARYQTTVREIVAHYSLAFPSCLDLIQRVFQPAINLNALPTISEWGTKFLTVRRNPVYAMPINYIKRASADAPILIVFLLDISQSMYYIHHQGKKRIDIALEMMNKILRKFRERSMSSSLIRPKYHFAFFCYHSRVVDVFYQLDGYKASIIPLDKFQERDPLTSERIDSFNRDGLRNNDGAATNMTLAFEELHNFLQHHILSYTNSHPPFVFHITDGLNTGNATELEQQFQHIQNIRTADGATLVSSFYIHNSGNSNADDTQDLTFCTPNLELHGTDDFKLAIRTLISTSSTIPYTYRKNAADTGMHISDTAKFVFSYQSNENTIAVAIALASATGAPHGFRHAIPCNVCMYGLP